MQNTRAVSVLRVSTTKQMREGESIANQRRENRAYIEKKGYKLVKEFELAESASKEERKGFEAVVSYCMENSDKIDVLVFWKIDRISRGGLTAFYAFKAVLAKHGIRFESATESFDQSPAGEMLEGMLALMAQFENRNKTERTIKSEISLTQEGYWTRAAPTGFKNGRDANKKPILLPCDDEKQWSLLCHGLRKQCSGIYKAAEVARELADKGLVSRYGNPISAQTWAKICRSPIYGGLICGKWTNGQYIDARFDGAITSSEWWKLQGILEGRRRSPLNIKRQKNNPDFPLRGFLQCPKCSSPSRGYPAMSKSGKKYHYYDCKSKDCKYRVPAENVHRDFLAYLQSVTPSPELLSLFRNIVLEVWEEKYKELNRESIECAQHLTDLKKEKQIVFELMKKNHDDSSILEGLKTDYKRIEKDIIVFTAERENKEIEEYDTEAVVNYCTYFLKNASELWLKAPIEHKTKLQQLVLPNGISSDELAGKRTPRLSPVYAAFGDIRTHKSDMVAHTPTELYGVCFSARGKAYVRSGSTNTGCDYGKQCHSRSVLPGIR